MEENKKSKIEATIKTMLYKQAKDKITKEEEELSYRKLHNLLEYKLKKENKSIPNGLSYATNYYYKKHKQNIRAKLRRVKQNKYITKALEYMAVIGMSPSTVLMWSLPPIHTSRFPLEFCFIPTPHSFDIRDSISCVVCISFC